MKGRIMRRFGGALKSKSIHGVSSKHHDNPHVMRAHRASGGACAEGAGGAPSLSAPGRKKGGMVKMMPQVQSKGDAKRVETGMPKRDGSDKSGGGSCNRAAGGKVKENWPGYKGETKAGAAASGGKGLKSSGPQSGKAAMVEKGMSSKGKDDGMVKKGQGDGTTNQSGKKFAAGGSTKDEGKKEEDEDDDTDADSDDEADESAAKDIVKGADATAYGVRTEERRHGGHVKEGLYDDAHHDDEYAKGGKAKRAGGGNVKDSVARGASTVQAVEGIAKGYRNSQARQEVERNPQDAARVIKSDPPWNEDSSIAGRSKGGKAKR